MRVGMNMWQALRAGESMKRLQVHIFRHQILGELISLLSTARKKGVFKNVSFRHVGPNVSRVILPVRNEWGCIKYLVLLMRLCSMINTMKKI